VGVLGDLSAIGGKDIRISRQRREKVSVRGCQKLPLVRRRESRRPVGEEIKNTGRKCVTSKWWNLGDLSRRKGEKGTRGNMQIMRPEMRDFEKNGQQGVWVVFGGGGGGGGGGGWGFATG